MRPLTVSVKDTHHEVPTILTFRYSNGPFAGKGNTHIPTSLIKIQLSPPPTL